MAKGEQYEARVEAWITPVLEQHQFELVDVEYVREVGVWYLRPDLPPTRSDFSI